MSIKNESMIGIMNLYDLRREATMREARKWFAAFDPESFEDIVNSATGEDNAYFRMVLTYWDMAASFVNHGAIDEQMFNDANTEHIAAFAKVEPFLAELRSFTKRGQLLSNLEQLVTRIPEIEEIIANHREQTKAVKAAAANAA